MVADGRVRQSSIVQLETTGISVRQEDWQGRRGEAKNGQRHEAPCLPVRVKDTARLSRRSVLGLLCPVSRFGHSKHAIGRQS